MGALGNPLGRRTAELEAEGEQSTHQLGHKMGKMDHERIRTPRADSVCVEGQRGVHLSQAQDMLGTLNCFLRVTGS